MEKETIQKYIDLFNARRAVDGEPPIPDDELPLYERGLNITPQSQLGLPGYKAEAYVKAMVEIWKKNY